MEVWTLCLHKPAGTTFCFAPWTLCFTLAPIPMQRKKNLGFLHRLPLERSTEEVAAEKSSFLSLLPLVVPNIFLQKYMTY